MSDQPRSSVPGSPANCESGLEILEGTGSAFAVEMVSPNRRLGGAVRPLQACSEALL